MSGATIIPRGVSETKRAARPVALAVLVVLVAGVGFGAGWAGGAWRGFPVAGLVVDGRQLVSDTPSIVIDGVTYIPLRSLAGLVGWELEWDQETGTVIVTTGAWEEVDGLSQIYDTGWVQRLQGATSQLTLPPGVIVSKKVQFKGRSVTTPAYSVVVAQNQHTQKWPYWDRILWWSASPPAYDRATSGSDMAIAVYRTGEDWYGQNDMYADPVTATVWAKYWKDYPATTTDTTDPSVTINGVTTGHTGTLADGATSPEYDLGGLVPGTANTISYAVSGSGKVDARIVVTMILAPTVSVHEPGPFENTLVRSALIFRLSATFDPDTTATTWFPRIIADRYQKWADPGYTWDASVSRAGWEYDNGGVWTALPVEGAPLASQVRLTPPERLDMLSVRWYYRASAYESHTGWGDPCAARYLRLVLHVVAAYSLEINGGNWDGRADQLVEVVAGANGERSSIQFRLRVKEELAEVPPEPGQQVDIAIRDPGGGIEQHTGWIESVERVSPGMFFVRALTGDSIMSRRIITRATPYPSQDIGLTLKAIIDDYCPPLDSTNINTATGIVRSIEVFGKTVMDVFRSVCSEAGLFFWCDASASPQGVWVMWPSNLGQPKNVFRRGE
jgi:hypothetical protein